MSHLEYFKNRHTIRKYQSQEISKEKLDEMLAAAFHAPNTGNMQWYSVVVTRDENKKQELAPAHFNQPSVTGAAAVLTFCIDLNRFEHWCKINNAQPGFNNFQSFIAGIIDTSIVAQQFCTIAELSGFGTCYLGTTAYNAPLIADILKLPKRVVPVITVTVGLPLETEPQGATTRIPAQAIIHYEQYQHPTDEDIRSYYKQIEEESHKFVVENAKETLAQVFTDIRYPKESAEHFSKIYQEFIKENEF